MRKFLLATTLLVGAIRLAGVAAAADTVISPGQGSLTDVLGHTWTITANGSVKENDTWTPGGGGTSRLTIVKGVVYGEDSSGRGWFALGGNYWQPAPTPPGIASTISTAPASPATATATIAKPASYCGNYAVYGGQFYGLDNKPFVPKGVNVPYGGMNPSAATILAAFPGTQIVRMPVFHNESGKELTPYVNDLTSHGLIVIIEDHHDNNPGTSNSGGAAGTVFTGSELSNELAWHADISTTFASNPRVWQASKNEPPEATTTGGSNNPEALSQWQLQEYRAVRKTSNNVFLVEINSWGPGQTANGYDPAVYAQMDNVALDVHWYGWPIPDQIGGHANYGMDPAVALATLKAMTSEAQQIKTNGGVTPAIFLGELGDSTTGQAIDRNWQQVLSSAFASGFGYAAWAWGVGPGDKLTDGDRPSNGFGTMIAADIAKSPPAGQAAACSAAPVASTTPTAAKTSIVMAAGPATPATPDPNAAITLSGQALAVNSAQTTAAAREALTVQVQQIDATTAANNDAAAAQDAAQAAQVNNATQLLQSILGQIHQ